MLSLVQKFHREVCLLLLLLGGLACGHLVDTLLQMNLRPAYSGASTVTPAVTVRALKTTQADLNLILQNNIFDTNNRSSAAMMTFDPGAIQGAEGSAKLARADFKLFGTVVAAERSQVLLEVNKELSLYHLGDKLPDDGTIEDIRRNQVDIKYRDQSVVTLMLNEQEPLSTGVASPAAGTSGDTGEGVRVVGENRWLISRNTIESVRENFADQLRLAQMQPRTVDGKTNGFLVQRINPRSLLVKLGVQRGDVIMDVNNIKLDSPEKALQVFQQLREARQISVAVERNGQPMSFAYEVE